MSVSWIVDCLSTSALCILIIGVAIPRVQLLAYRKNLLDKPAKRKVHKAPTPRLGGTTFLPALMLSFTIVVAVNIVTRQGELLAEVASESLPLASVFCALILSYILGVVDDIRGVGYHLKFIAQSISVLIIIFSGVELSGLRTLLLLASWPQWTVVPLTALAMVFIINAINLIDGIDGLASGLCILSFVCYGIAFVFCSQNIYALLSFAFVGVLIPFFYYNVFGTQRKRKIFMGDTGSLTLGMMLCFLNIKLTQMPQDSLPHINKYLLAALPLMIPCFDVMRVFAYRLLHGNNPFLPDNNHIHHLLIRTGLSERTTMITLILSSALLTLTNVMLCNDLGVMLLLAADITLWIVVNIIIDLLLKRKEKRTNNSLIEKQ